MGVDKPADFALEILIFRCTSEAAMRRSLQDMQLGLHSRCPQSTVHAHSIRQEEISCSAHK
jgi:hypothetical protein